VVDSDRSWGEDAQVAPDATANVERPSETLAAQVPVVRGLNVQESLPPEGLLSAKALCIVSGIGTQAEPPG